MPARRGHLQHHARFRSASSWHVEIAPVKDWPKPPAEWRLDYGGVWGVKCNRIHYYRKAAPPLEVITQIDVGEADVEKKGLQTKMKW